MIDALFGSKTRVKLLHLFLSNPGKSFYVREITRLIDEQINSVRRELANMLNVGIISSDTADNKLYYQVNQRYEYYVPLRAIFADDKTAANEVAVQPDRQLWRSDLETLPQARLIVLAGMLVRDQGGQVDLLVVGDVNQARLKKIVASIEQQEGRDINYTSLSYDDFYYRLSMRDKFITQIITGKHSTLVDTDGLLNTTD